MSHINHRRKNYPPVCRLKGLKWYSYEHVLDRSSRKVRRIRYNRRFRHIEHQLIRAGRYDDLLTKNVYDIWSEYMYWP